MSSEAARSRPPTPRVGLRSLLGGQPVGADIWGALAWCIALALVAYYVAMRAYKRVP